MNTIIAVPTRTDRTVHDHFGHCAQFLIAPFSVSDGKAVQEAGIANSRRQAVDASPTLPRFYKQKGVSVLLAGGMGDGAMNMLQAPRHPSASRLLRRRVQSGRSFCGGE